MIRWGKRRRFALWNVCVLGLFAVGCTSTDYSQRLVRKPTPSDSESANFYPVPVKKGLILVKRGDSLYTIARRNGVALRGLMQANGLKPPYVIHPGQLLRLPVSRYHKVAKGQTVYQISRLHDVDMGALVRINRIKPPYRVVPGQQLRLPESRVTRAAVADRRAAIRPRPQGVSWPRRLASRDVPRPPTLSAGWRKPDPTPIGKPPPRAGPRFLWPVRGRVIEAFGARAGGLHNDGINIAARSGASIRAAENGVVAYTGNQLQGFGNLVLVKHAGGWMSAYAHSSKILVKRGDIVRRGQVIAKVGRTGNVSKPQLHFELRRGERAVNPRSFLVRIARLTAGGRLYAGLIPASGPVTD